MVQLNQILLHLFLSYKVSGHLSLIELVCLYSSYQRKLFSCLCLRRIVYMGTRMFETRIPV